MVFILKSWKKGTETNIFIIQCARFAKRSLLTLTNSVSILIRLTGRKILVHNKNYHLRQRISESVSKQILHTISLGYYSVHLSLTYQIQRQRNRESVSAKKEKLNLCVQYWCEQMNKKNLYSMATWSLSCCEKLSVIVFLRFIGMQ